MHVKCHPNSELSDIRQLDNQLQENVTFKIATESGRNENQIKLRFGKNRIFTCVHIYVINNLLVWDF